MSNNANNAQANASTGKCEEIAGKEKTMATWKKISVGIYDAYTNGEHTVLKKGMKNWEIEYQGHAYSFATLKEAKMLAESGLKNVSVDEAIEAIAKAKAQATIEKAQAKADADKLERAATEIAKDFIEEIDAEVPRVFVEIPDDEVVKSAVAQAIEEFRRQDLRRGHNRRKLAAARKKADEALAEYREICGNADEVDDVLEDENTTAERRAAFRKVQKARSDFDALEIECAEVEDKVFDGNTVYVLSRLMNAEDYEYIVRVKAFNAYDEGLGKADPSKEQKAVLRCLRTEMKDARKKAQEAEETFFGYSLGIATDEMRPTSALVPAYKVVKRVNEILFGDNACGIKRDYVNYNVSDPALMLSASRAIAKKVVDNATERHCTPTQLGMYFAARTGDWEEHNLADMVSSASDGIAYAIAPRDFVSNTREMAKLLIDVGGKLAEIAPRDKRARQEVLNLLDIDSAIQRAFDIRYNRLCDASARVMELEADHRRVRAYANDLLDRSWTSDPKAVEAASREVDNAVERVNIAVSKAIRRAVNEDVALVKAREEVERLRTVELADTRAYNEAHKALVDKASKEARAKEIEALAEWVKDARVFSNRAFDEYDASLAEFRKARAVFERKAKYAEAVEVFATPFMDVPRTKEMSDEDKARLDEYATLLFEAEELYAQAKADLESAHDRMVRKRKSAMIAYREYKDYRDRVITSKVVYAKDDENAKALYLKMRASIKARKAAARKMKAIEMDTESRVLDTAHNTADVLELREKLNGIIDARDEAERVLKGIAQVVHEDVAKVDIAKRKYHEFEAIGSTPEEIYTQVFEVADALYNARARLNHSTEEYGAARGKYNKACKAYASAVTPPDDENKLCLAQKLDKAEREAVTKYFITRDDQARQENKALGKARKALALAKIQEKHDRECAITKARALPEVVRAFDDERFVKRAVDEALAEVDKARREYNAIAKSAKAEIAKYTSHDGELMVKRGELLLEVVDAVAEIDDAPAPFYKVLANRAMVIAGFHFVNDYLAYQRSVRDDCKYGTLSIEELDRYIEDPRVYAESEASEYEIRRRKYIRAAWKPFFDALTPTQVNVVKALDKCVTETEMDGKITRVSKMLKRSKVTIHEHVMIITKVFAQALKSVAPDSIELASANLFALASEKSAVECRKELELATARAKCKDAKEAEKECAEEAIKALENASNDAKVASAINGAIAYVFEHKLSPAMAEYTKMIAEGKSISEIARLKGKARPTIIESRNRACDLFADAIKGALVKLEVADLVESVEKLRAAHDIASLMAMAA